MAPVFTGNWFGFGRNPASGPSGPSDTSFASGGIINDVEISGTLYRAHIFTSSGSLVVNGPGSKNMTYLVVGGGGGGSHTNGISGAAGAGGLRTNLPGVVDGGSNPLTISTAFPLSAGTYPVTVGSGGGAGQGSPATGYFGHQGGDSQFGPPTGTAVSGKLVATGGGRGRTNEGGYPTAPIDQGYPGGCGGGGTGNSGPGSPGGEGNVGGDYDGKPEGKDGGVGGPTGNYGSGGGGGVGVVGGAYGGGSTNGEGGSGGNGVQCLILGPDTQSKYGLGAPGPSSSTGWFGGGGGSSGYTGGNHGTGGAGGGGGSAYSPQGLPQNGGGAPGALYTGGGGGSAGAYGAAETGGDGGPGVVVVRYEISSADGDAKATGGNIDFYNGKTIHTFLAPGNFVTDGDMGSQTAEYVVLAGGGSGGSSGGFGGGGGGAGGYLTGTTPIGNSQTIPVNVGEGARSRGENKGMGYQGDPSAVAFPAGTITATGGGGGGYDNGPYSTKGDPGGSGGGNSGGPQTQGGPSEGTSGQGNDGGEGSANGNPAGAGGGGGGAGGVGATAPTNHTPAGAGGVGVQLPGTFQDPHMATALGYPGPTGNYWVAGGGGGGCAYNGTNPGGGGGGNPTPNESWAGAGYGCRRGTAPATAGGANSGSGGGGGAGPNGAGGDRQYLNNAGGQGGSGIVLIAYPT